MRRVVAVALTCLLAACSGETSPPPTESTAGTTTAAPSVDEELLAEVEQWRAAWQRAAVPDYRLGLVESCTDCPPDTPGIESVVTVRAFQPTNETERAAGAIAEITRVEDIFDRIAAAVRRGEIVHAEYDPETGLPMAVMFSDHNVRLDVVEFRVLPGLATDAAGIARQRWDAHAAADYSFTLTMLCSCPPEEQGPFEIVVVNGAVAAVRRNGTEVANAAAYRTIDELFDFVLAADEAGRLSSATYHPEFGYPMFVALALGDDEFDPENDRGFSLTGLVLPDR